MSVSLKGFNESVATFYTDDANLEAGDLVIINDNLEVEKAASTELFVGVCQSVRSGYAAVQLSGFVELSYSGTAPTVGYNNLYTNSSGGVVANDSGRQLLVVSVNTTDSKCGIIL